MVVAGPVATTTASPSPSTTKVPASTVSPARWRTGALSPVTRDSSTESECATVSLMSAPIRSPEARSTTSSRTSAIASMVRSAPSRRTRTRVGSRASSRSAERSARYSCANAKSALSTITTRMAVASGGIPPRRASAAATQSSSASRWVNCPTNCRSREGRAGRGSRFGPSRAALASAWEVLRPDWGRRIGDSTVGIQRPISTPCAGNTSRPERGCSVESRPPTRDSNSARHPAHRDPSVVGSELAALSSGSGERSVDEKGLRAAGMEAESSLDGGIASCFEAREQNQPRGAVATEATRPPVRWVTFPLSVSTR